MALQAAFGGVRVAATDALINSITYYEPGFNLMSPLEFSVEEADSVYILVRKRDNSNNGFETIVASDLTVTAVDATNNEPIFVQVISNTKNDAWDGDPSSYSPVVVDIRNQIGQNGAHLRIRVIDCKIIDNNDDSFINFRIVVDEEATKLYYSYIPVNRKFLADRNTFSIYGRQAYITLNNGSDAHVLIAPYVSIRETTKELADFSYPFDSFYYKIDDAFNKENFSFTISAFSHTWVEQSASLLSLSGVGNIAVLLIDSYFYKKLQGQSQNVSLTISTVGELSGIEDSFVVNFKT